MPVGCVTSKGRRRGEDVLYSYLGGGRSNDVLDGGSATDIYLRFCRSCTIKIDGIANDGASGTDEQDQVLAELIEIDSQVPFGEPDEGAPIGSGADRIVGSDQDNWLFGARGPDVIVGKAGEDLVGGGEGPDLIRAADGERDEVRCARGRMDRAVVDRIDEVSGCERVTVRR